MTREQIGGCWHCRTLVGSPVGFLTSDQPDTNPITADCDCTGSCSGAIGTDGMCSLDDCQVPRETVGEIITWTGTGSYVGCVVLGVDTVKADTSILNVTTARSA